MKMQRIWWSNCTLCALCKSAPGDLWPL